MTIKDVIQELQWIKDGTVLNPDAYNALKISIEVLQQTDSDTISRRAAIDAIKKSRFLVDAMEKVIRVPSAQSEVAKVINDLNKMFELKPCPFCGSQDVVKVIEGTRHPMIYVRCNTCLSMSGWYEAEEENIMVSAWNKRAGEQK